MISLNEVHPESCDQVGLTTLLIYIYMILVFAWYKIIQSYTAINLLEVLVLFLTTCFGSYTAPSLG